MPGLGFRTGLSFRPEWLEEPVRPEEPVRTPDQILGANLAVWLNAQRSTITSSGGRVSQIADISGNARHFTQPTATKQPLETTRGDKPALYFDRSRLDFIARANWGLSAPCLWLVVMDWADGSATDRAAVFTRDYDPGTSTNWFIGLNGASAGANSLRFSDQQQSPHIHSFTADPTGRAAWIINHGTGNSYIRKAGMQLVASDHGAGFTQDYDFMVGADSWGMATTMYLHELVIATGDYDANAVAELETYAASEWGL